MKRYRVPLTMCVAPVIEFEASVLVEADSAQEAARMATLRPDTTWRKKPGQPKTWTPARCPGGKATEYLDEERLNAWIESQS